MARKRTAKPAVQTTESTRPPIDASYVMGLYSSRIAQGDEVKLRSDIATARSLCELTHKVEIPEQYKAITKEVRTPFTRDALTRITASLTQHAPVAHVEAVDDTREQDRSAANLAERWTMAAMESMTESLGEDVIYEDTKALVRDSEAVIKVVHRPDAWATFPEREAKEDAESYQRRVVGYQKRARTPFAWRVVDRLSMLFGDGEFGDDWALEYGEYPTPYLASRYGMREKEGRLYNPADLLGGKPKPEGMLQASDGRCIKVEYWDCETWAVVIDGELAPGFPQKNPYGQVPYFRAKVSDAVLKALTYLVPALDSLITMKMNWAYLGAYPNPVLEPVPNTQQLPFAETEGMDGQKPVFTWKPGKLLQTPTGYKFGFVSPPPVGQDIDETIAILRNLVDIAGIPSVFRGVGGSDQPGYAINQLIAAATLTYRILTIALQRQLNAAGTFLWDLVAYRIRQPVYINERYEIAANGTRKERKDKGWLCLKPMASEGPGGKNVAACDQLGKLSFAFRPVLPTDEQARTMIAIQATNAPKPLYGVRHALERQLQEEDPESIMDEAWVEQAVNNAPLNAEIIQEAMRRANLGQQQRSGLVGANGQPLPPGGAPGVSGMPSVPGVTMPMTPTPPQPSGILPGNGGRVAGSYPGQPGGADNAR